MSAIINGIDNDGVKSGEGNGGNGEASVGAASDLMSQRWQMKFQHFP